ncbi:MAG: methylmalonyl-CoA mutase family protein [Myxococcota bacterium]|nr:methylmalonyl-CoA mutase family protein [Myxococcota bacterium]
MSSDPFHNWKERYLDPVTQKFGTRRDTFETSSGIPVGPIQYRHQTDSETRLGFPGEFPFTRGVQPTMYRSKFWTMRQYAGFGTAEESNKRYRYLLEQGTTGLSVAFDLPTQMGMDSDDPMCLGEVGKVGVAIDSIEDMETLFDSIPLDKISTSMTINSSASVLLAMYYSVAQKQGVDGSQIRGTIQNDLLKEYIARGTYIYPPRPSMRIITDIFDWCAKNTPNWNTISISGYHIREAGSTAAQELAFTLADGIAYVEAALECGLDVDQFGRRLSFFFNAHNHFLEEIAKFRAARRMWANIMKSRFGATTDRACKLRFHTQTGGSTLTAQQVDNNVVRVTLQALAAVMGGTQSLHTNGRDEALGLPTPEAAKLALRTQQVIAHESGVADFVDPFAGSFAIEQLTDELEAKAYEYIKKIDELGGMISAIEAGYVQREIQDSAYRAQLAIESREQVIVGMNQFTETESVDNDVLKIDPVLEQQQVERVRAWRIKRSDGVLEHHQARLIDGARGSENLMGLIVDAVQAGLTVGEICGAMKSVFGRYVEPVII